MVAQPCEFSKITDLYTLKKWILGYMGYTIIKTLETPKQSISQQNPAVHFKKYASIPMGFIVGFKMVYYLETYLNK